MTTVLSLLFFSCFVCGLRPLITTDFKFFPRLPTYKVSWILITTFAHALSGLSFIISLQLLVICLLYSRIMPDLEYHKRPEEENRVLVVADFTIQYKK